jgi:F-type H+-transporting ATPase subunit delta
MSGESTTIARPYAEAVFSRAMESGGLELWSEMLELLSGVVRDPAMVELTARSKLNRDQLAELLIEIGGGRLSQEGQNLVRLLARNGRVAVLPEIATLFERLKSEQEGVIDVVVSSAFPVKPADEQALAEALQRKLGREVRISSEQDPELIGGVRVRAGDLVIDGSVSAQLRQLAGALGA